MPQPLDRIAHGLRAAVLAGDHARAARFTTQYKEAVQAIWSALPEVDRAASPIPKKARELLAWALDVTIVQRALASEQMAILEKTCRYQPAGWLESRSRAIDVRA